MAHPFQQRKLFITVCKAEVGWDHPESAALLSGYITLVAGPFRASTRSVPATRRARAGPQGSTSATATTATTASPSSSQQLSWAPSLGGEVFVLTEDCLLVADLVVGAELWGTRAGGRWGASSEALYAQSEICLDAEGQALLLSGRCLEVRLPLMAPQGQGGGAGGAGGAGGKGKGGGGAGGGSRRDAAGATGAAPPPPPPPVLGVLALSMLLQPADADAAVARHLPPELVPRLLLDTSRLLPGAVVRGAAGVAYVDPCVVFLRVRLISAAGLGRGGKDGPMSRSSTPGHHHHHHHSHHGRQQQQQQHGLPGHLHELGAKLQAHMDRTMGHVGAFFSRFREQHNNRNNSSRSRGVTATAAAEPPPTPPPPPAAAAEPGPTGGDGTPHRRSMEGLHSHDISGGAGGGGGAAGGGSGGRELGVDRAAAEAVMSLLESNGFAVVDNRRLSNYFWCKVSYEGQYHTSRLVPVSGGAVRWDETFVIAALRPVRNAPLEIELYGSNDSKSRGKVVCQLSVPLCDLMDQVLRNHHYHHQQRRMDEQQQHDQQHQLNRNSLNLEHERHPQQQQQQQRSWSQFGASLPGVQALKSAFATATAAVAGGNAASGGGAGGLPPYHPDSWPRGRAVLTARVGGPGGAAAATHGSPLGPDGGARECRFTFEVEVVDSGPRATAYDTALLPWATATAPPYNHQPAAAGEATAAAGSLLGGGEFVGGGVTATRQGSAGSTTVGAAADAAAVAGGSAAAAVMSPPWSPVSRGGGTVSGLLSPTGVGANGGVLSLGSVVASCFAHEGAPAAPPSTGTATAAQPPPSPALPPAGEEDLWLPPRGLPHIRSHVANGARDDASVQASSPAATEATVGDLLDSPTAAAADALSAPATAPETGVPCTPTGRADRGGGSAAAVAAAAAAAAAAAPPPPGLCPAAALAAAACATLSLVCHDLELERPAPPEAAVGGSGVAVGGQAAAHAAAVAAITQGDYFVAIRCGSVWVTTNSLRVVGTAGGGGGSAATAASTGAASAAAAAASGGGGSGGARLTPHLGLVAPLLKPSALVSLALFRRTDVVAGKKVLNVRAMIGMMAAEQVVGKLRFRASSLVPGRPVTVCLPLKAERSGPRPCATVAWCRLTLLLSPGPGGLARLLAAYAEPPTHPPVAMLQDGAVPGRGLSATLPSRDPAKKVEPEALRRRERRLLIKWVSESSPGLSANASRKLVEDGRTEFNAGRTTQNWRRIGRALSSTEPLKRFWVRVQSWASPPLTLAVAAGEVALLAWPSRTIAVALLALLLRMALARAALLPPTEGEGEGEERGAGVAGAAAVGEGEDCGGGTAARTAAATAVGLVSYFGEPPAMVDDLGNEPETAAANSGGDAAPEPTAHGAGGSGVPVSSTVPPTPTASAASAASAALAGAFSNPVPIPPTPSGAASSATASMTSAAAGWIFGASSPPAAGGVGVVAGSEWAVQQQVLLQRGGGAASSSGPFPGGGGGGAEVPKDPLGALRQQYDQMVYFGLRVQNVLDDIAGGMERMQALLSWRDPVASSCFAAGLALTAVALWTVGMRVVLGVVLLYDLRPPRWRDPWLPPPANAFAHLPTRADLMM